MQEIVYFFPAKLFRNASERKIKTTINFKENNFFSRPVLRNSQNIKNKINKFKFEFGTDFLIIFLFNLYN